MNLGIRRQLLLFTMAAILLVGGSLSTVSLLENRHRILTSFEKKGRDIAELVSHSVAKNIYFLDIAALHAQLSETHVDPDIQNMSVLDPSGRVLADATPDNIHRDEAPSDAFTRTLVRSKAWTYMMAAERYLVGTPIRMADGTCIGFLVVDYSLTNAYENMRAATWLQLGVTLLCLAFGGLFAAFASTRFTRPILEIVRTSQIIGDGNLEARIASGRHDELGLLAASINGMAEHLNQTMVSKAYFNHIIQSLADTLLVIDRSGMIMMANPAALRLLHHEEKNILGRPVGDIVPPELLEKSILNHLSAGEPLERFETTYRRSDGRPIPVLFSESILHNDQRQIQGVLYVAQDLSERKKLEHRILQSDKMAAVGKLAAGVAHEINNPLGVILGFVEIALDSHPDEPLQGPLKSIEREAIRCKNLVEQLLTFSRSGPLEFNPLDLNEAVEGAMPLIAARAQQSEINIETTLAPESLYLLGSRTQTQQILINVANNAIDAMSPGGLLTIRTELAVDAGREWVGLRVIDTGPGIASDVLPRIFEPFFTTKEIGKGTGLGLALVHEIVQRHAGTLDVVTRPGHTEFIVRFARVSEKQPA